MYIPKYSITNKILKNIGAIEAAKEVIENAPLVPYYEKQFRTDAIARTIHHGTHIEGNDLSLLETKRLLEGVEVVAHERDIQEVINYRNVMRFLDELSRVKNEYDADTILEIHRKVVDKLVDPAKVGVFRTTQVVIKEENTGRVIISPPAAKDVPGLVDEFLSWLNSQESADLHPILRAGIAHYVLVSIHPFVEGNGRTVRAFANLILMREGYDIKRFFSLEEHFDNDLSQYYEAFASVDRQSPNVTDRDLTPWLEYFTYVVAIELSKIKDKVRRLSIDSKLKGKIGEQIALSERQMKIIEYLTEVGGAGMQDLKKQLRMVSEDTILRDLNKLIEKGIIKKEGRTKAAMYVISKS